MGIFVFSLFGYTILAVMVFGVTKQLNIRPGEDKAHVILNKLAIRKIKKKTAVKLIDHWLWCCLLKKRGLLYKHFHLVFKIKQLCSEFRTINR